jgi:hypothetical protein
MEATYLDCSGSLHGYDLSTHSVGRKFYFDTKVYEEKPDHYGGTDYSCIYLHAIEKGYTSIRIVTDGYGERIKAHPFLNVHWVIIHPDELQDYVPSEPVEETFVWVVKRNSDTTEGRGPMVVDSIWTADAEEECAAYIDGQHGVMGRTAKWSEAEYGDWTMERTPLFDSRSTKKSRDEADLRISALKKLSPKEKVALGLSPKIA